MKKTLLLSLAATLSLSAYADYSSAGYYRVHNYKTKRYVSVIDNRGSIDLANTTADLQAIKLQKNFDEVCCDPASVLYIRPVGSEYQIETQGTGIYQIISHYLKLKTNGSAEGQTLYKAYGELNGVIKYLGDNQFFPTDLGFMATNADGDYTRWFITPIDASGNNYFGLRPTVTAKGKNYLTMYGSFPYTPNNSGIKSYYISTVDNGMAVMKEIAGTVPAGTPVLIECPSTEASANRLNIGGSGNTVSGNKLNGVYFNNSVAGHINRVAYDKNTMRILGTCADGSLGFVTSQTLDYIPKNTAYLSVAAGSPAELKCVTQAEYDAFMASIPSAVNLSHTSLEMTEGDTFTLSATITPANPNDPTLTWSSSNSAVATVANGMVTAVAPGTATITVSTYNGKTATCAVTVKQRVIAATGISVNPTSYTCTEGDTFTITATVAPDNATDKTVTWSTSNAAVATVSNGVVSTLAPGSATITATTANGLTATCAVTVKQRVIAATGISVNPTSYTCTEGDAFTITATVAPDNATDKTVTWSTSNAAVATVSNGVVTTVAPGSATITATTSNGFTATCAVTVNKRIINPTGITLNPSSYACTEGDTFTITATVAPDNATDKTVTWSTSDASVATVDNGVVTAHSYGNVTITATTVNGISASCTVNVAQFIINVESVTVTPDSFMGDLGTTFQLTATVLPDNATEKTVTWTTSDETVATVSPDGLLTIVSAGTAVIRATANDGSGVSGVCYVTGEDSGIEQIIGEGSVTDVYDLQGRVVLRAADSERISKLPSGIYIIAGKKVIIR